MPRWYLTAKAHLDELFPGPVDEVDTSTPAAVSGDATVDEADPMCARLPFNGRPEEKAWLATANDSAWRLLERFRLNPDRPTTRGYHRTSDDWESITDPDVAPMKKGRPLILGYLNHYVVDGGKARIILAAVATPGDVMENKPMLDLLWRTRFRLRLHPRRAVGDSTYGTIENIRAVEDAGIRAYLPMRNYERRTPLYSASRSQYDAECDEYRCPEGQPLRFERVKNYYETAAYQKAIRKRQVCVEPLFGDAKQWHNLRWFRLRRLWRVNTEALLVAAGQNLKRWLSKTEWGRRQGLAGPLVLSPFSPPAPI
jgi:hypothetical protein